MTSLNEDIFDSKPEQAFLRWYHRVFSIKEIENSVALKWVFGAAILSHFIAFNSWFGNKATTVDAFNAGKYFCWPYFQSCGEFLFLRTLPEGYSQPFLYMVLFGTLLLAVYLMHKRDWVLAHLALMPSFIWHTLGTFVITGAFSGNYEYYLFILTFILLFLPHKEFFLKLVLVLFYFLAGSLKIHEGWVLGTYFSALKTGLPLFPDWSIPLWTNLVIFMEIVGAWFLFSKNWALQRLAIFFFVVFHLYSGLLVGFRYPVTVLPTLFILFGPFYQYTRVPLNKKAIAGWLLVAVLFPLQFISNIIPGDEKLTLEGNKYGLYMFEANHQCISNVTVTGSDNVINRSRKESESARSRCDPYKYLLQIQQQCKVAEKLGASIEWTFDHSINGGPFLRIVDEKKVCALEYKAFAHNEWIKTEKDSPEIIGYPVENQYR
ncbi:MAG: hypothetical protein JKX80_02235 [Candidatus Pacebacteria bacterium]|nr:hypothetical protein [Candidatus Paceibacterota bacterium]